MTITINISVVCVEDTIRFLLPFAGKRRIVRLSHNIPMDVSDQCCSCPIRVGQAIRIDSNHSPICVKENSVISYNLQQKRWEVDLGTWYMNCGLTEKGVISKYGFGSIEILQEGEQGAL